MKQLALLAVLGYSIFLEAPCFGASRLKDLVSLEGVRDNQLIGYGLVVGLANSAEGWQWGLLLPLGAVFFILSFVVTLLEKETALYDQEHHSNSA